MNPLNGLKTFCRRHFTDEPLLPFRQIANTAMTHDELESRVANYMATWTNQGAVWTASDYLNFLGRLSRSGSPWEFASASEFAAHSNPDVTALFLRHDIDDDLCGCILLAQHEREVGAKASYFVLHSDVDYYGCFDESKIFQRIAVADDYIWRIHELGGNIGLHIDPLGIIGKHGVDGIMAMVSELMRFRALGLPCNSVCSHNSASAYNAMNHDVFAGYNVSGQTEVETPTRRVRLGVVDAASVGVDLLCDFYRTVAIKPVQPTRSSYGYLIDCRPTFDFEYDLSLSAVVGKSWEVGGPMAQLFGTTIFDGLDLSDVLLRLPRGSKVVLNIHPMYFGGRMGPTKGL